MSEHQWGPADSGGNGIRTCQRIGCEVRWHVGRAWQERKGRRWTSGPIPSCRGVGANLERCSHIERPSGSQCSRPALPRLVVCEQHATPETFRLVILEMAAEIERLKSGG